jgi:predicted Zn-dependent peptidase
MTTKISKTELQRAKNQLKSQFLMGHESKITHLEDLGKQVLLFGDDVTDINETCKRIDMVEIQDLIRVARRIVLGENIESRFDFGGIMKHWKRTGNGEPSLVVSGHLSEKDPIYKAENVLGDWGLVKGSKKGRSKYSFFK